MSRSHRVISVGPLNAASESISRHGNCFDAPISMEWYARPGQAVMLLASGVVSIVVVERLHDLRRADDQATMTARVFSDDGVALRRMTRSSSPAVFVRENGDMAVIMGELRGIPRARGDACTGAHPDDIS